MYSHIYHCKTNIKVKQLFIYRTMKLNEKEVTRVMNDFPNVKLSYETIVHKKVYNADIILAIPEGKKCFAWFTTYKNDNVCFVLEIGYNKQIEGISIYLTSFTDSLAYGTVFYGTLFKYQANSCFCVEDVLFLKGKSLHQEPFIRKLQYIKEIFTNDLSTVALTPQFLIFGMPLTRPIGQFSLLLNEIDTLPYKARTIQFRYLYENKNNYFSMNYFKPGAQYKKTPNMKITNAVFKVTPDIQNDIYHLHIYQEGGFEFYDVAYIPDYSTSVKMNQLFRNIKENRNLDALEESDDEEEFENEREDKFVYLDKSFKMNCVYHQRFKKWVPLNIASKTDRVITRKMLT